MFFFFFFFFSSNQGFDGTHQKASKKEGKVRGILPNREGILDTLLGVFMIIKNLMRMVIAGRIKVFFLDLIFFFFSPTNKQTSTL